MHSLLFLLVGLAIGAGACYLVFRERVRALEQQTGEGPQQFLQLAGTALHPLRDSLQRLDQQIQDLEVRRASAYSGLTEQVKTLAGSNEKLQEETRRLVQALRTPAARGRWGELQLRRVVELAGMVEYCDFQEQQQVNTDDGKLRPDLVIHLPSRRRIVVDAKVSLAAYLDALECRDDGQRQLRLRDHAGQVRTHMTRLSQKQYWAQFESTPEFVIAFLPGESLFSAALEHDPALIEFGAGAQVILATPTTLIALLKAVAYGWRQEQMAQNAAEVSALGRELYERLGTFQKHLTEVGTNLERAVQGYNNAVGSMESRVLVSARRLRDLGATGSPELPITEPVDRAVRVTRVSGE